jgi:hypothetical protein
MNESDILWLNNHLSYSVVVQHGYLSKQYTLVHVNLLSTLKERSIKIGDTEQRLTQYGMILLIKLQADPSYDGVNTIFMSQFTMSLATISTDSPSIWAFIHIIVLDLHRKIKVLNIHAMN